MAGWFAISLVAVTALIGTVVIVFARAAARTSNDEATPAVRATLWIAAIWAIAGVIGALAVVLTTLMQRDIDITVPVQEFWPRLPSGAEFEGPTASLEGGGFTTAELHAGGLSTGVRVQWAAAQAIGWLVPATIAALIAVASSQLLAGRAFRPLVARMAMITAIVVAVGGIAVQVLGDTAGYQAGVELLQVGSAMYPDIPQFPDSDMSTWLPRPEFRLLVPFWPIAAGLAFAALAAIFRSGSRLQRDTEGLV